MQYTAGWLRRKIADLVYRAKVEPARPSHSSVAVADRIMHWVSLYIEERERKNG